MLARPIKACARSDADTQTADREGPLEPQPALLELSSLGPEPEQRARDLDATLDEGCRSSGPIRALLGRSPARCRQSPEQRQLPVAAENGPCPSKLLEEEIEMPLTKPFGVAGAARDVRAHTGGPFEETVSVLAGRPRCPPTTSDLSTSRDSRSSTSLWLTPSPPHTCSAASSVHPPGNTESRPNNSPFGIREQLVAPVHGRLERPLPGDRRSRAAGEQAESVLQARLDLLRRQDHGAGGRQLDGERNPIETLGRCGRWRPHCPASVRRRRRRRSHAR